MSASRWVHIDVEEITAATEKALLCLIGDEEVWLPRSQVSDGDDYAKGDQNLTLSISEFIANEKGL